MNNKERFRKKVEVFRDLIEDFKAAKNISENMEIECSVLLENNKNTGLKPEEKEVLMNKYAGE